MKRDTWKEFIKGDLTIRLDNREIYDIFLKEFEKYCHIDLTSYVNGCTFPIYIIYADACKCLLLGDVEQNICEIPNVTFEDFFKEENDMKNKKVRNVWDEFENGKIVVECRKPHELRGFYASLYKLGIRHIHGEHPLSPKMLEKMYSKLPLYIMLEENALGEKCVIVAHFDIFNEDVVDILSYDDFMAEDYKWINSDINKKIVITFDVVETGLGADAEIYNKNGVCMGRFGSHGYGQGPFDYALKAIKVFEKRRDEALKNKNQWVTDSLGQILPDRIAKKLNDMPRNAGVDVLYDTKYWYGIWPRCGGKTKWDEFKAGKFAVEVDATNILLFLKECENEGLVWVSGDKPLQYIPEFVSKANGNVYMIYNDTLKKLQCLHPYAVTGKTLTYDEFVKRD